MSRKLMFATACTLQSKYDQYCAHEIRPLCRAHLYGQWAIEARPNTAAYSLFVDFKSFAFRSVRFR